MDPITIMLGIGTKVIDRLWPDPAQAAAAKLELFKLQQSGELAVITGQMEINKNEAANPSVFVSGWRPFIGWICGVSLCYVAIIEPVARFTAQVWFHYTGAFPTIDTQLTMQVLLGMLGLGAMRSAEKIKGAENNR